MRVLTVGKGPFEVTYIDAFGRLCSARYLTECGARAGFAIARNLRPRLWLHGVNA